MSRLVDLLQKVNSRNVEFDDAVEFVELTYPMVFGGDIYVCNGHYLIVPKDQLIPGITFESDPIKVSVNIILFRFNDLPKEDESINEEEFFY